MPLVVLFLMLAPMGVATVGIQQEYTKEQKINEICVQKFQKVDEIKQCKAVLTKMQN